MKKDSKQKVLLWISMLTLSTLVNVSIAATLLSTVDKNVVGLNDIISLVVEYDQKSDASELDVSSLQSDFEILSLRPQSNSSITIVNGETKQVAQTKWVLALTPKRAGVLEIPVLNLNGDKSRPIQIQVSDNPDLNSRSTSPLIATISTNLDSVYPGQEMIVSIELSAKNGVGDLNGAPFELDNAEVETLSQNSFRRVDNGIARQIVELKFSVFAKTPGVLRIPSLTYTGVEGGRRSFFGSSGNQVLARTDEVTIDVKTIPSDLHEWFPASSVSIRSEWSENKSSATVGDPITRTIVVTANSQRATAIAPLKSPNQTDQPYKSYDEKPRLHTQNTATGLVATRVESSAIVPSQAGVLELPEITLNWWDVGANKWQEATLPAETIKVAAGNASANQTALPPSNNKQDADSAKTSSGSNQSNQTGNLNLILWQSVSLLLAMLCAAQFFILRNRRAKADFHEPNTSEKQAWKTLLSDLKTGDSHKIRESIRLWGQLALETNQPCSLSDLSRYVDSSSFKQALEHLDSHLFNNGKAPDIGDLESALDEGRDWIKNNKTNARKTALAPLYP